jgi:hypothetical protein
VQQPDGAAEALLRKIEAELGGQYERSMTPDHGDRSHETFPLEKSALPNLRSRIYTQATPYNENAEAHF